MEDVEEEAEWKKERMRVLDEWCEIELKGADALKQAVVSEAPGGSSPVAPETSLQDLYPLLTTSTSSKAEEEEEEGVTAPEATTSAAARSTLERLLDICLCRPSSSSTKGSPLVYTHKSLLLKLSTVPYDAANGTHWLLLADYYRNVASAMRTPSEVAEDVTPPKPARVGPHWVAVGFQSATPETDFRGCGVLGLLQMHTFTAKLSPPVLRAIVKLATTEPNDFPLAVVSINITSLLLTQLKKGAFDSFGTESDGLYPFFATLHAATIAKFCAIYKTQKCTLAQTQSIFSDLSRQLEKSPLPLLLLLNPNNDELRNALLL